MFGFGANNSMPDKGSGQKIDWRVPLEAKTVLDAKRKLEKFKILEQCKKTNQQFRGSTSQTMECFLLQLANLSDQSRRRTSNTEQQKPKEAAQADCRVVLTPLVSFSGSYD